MLTLIACGAGFCLGLYFNILMLLPFSIAGAGLIFSFSLTGRFDGAGALFAALISVQFGFMFGLTARDTYSQLLARLNIGRSKGI
jgi:hypothetical protein